MPVAVIELPASSLPSAQELVRLAGLELQSFAGIDAWAGDSAMRVGSPESNGTTTVAAAAGSLPAETGPGSPMSGSMAATASLNSGSEADAGNDLPECLLISGPLEAVLENERIKALLGQMTGLPVAVLCHRPSVELAIQAMRQGCGEILIADQATEQLAVALQRFVTQHHATASAASERLVLRERMTLLTAAEHDVLDAMLDGLANKQIAQALQIGLRTVELRRSKIMKKMGAKSLAQLVKFICIAQGIGHSVAPTSNGQLTT